MLDLPVDDDPEVSLPNFRICTATCWPSQALPLRFGTKPTNWYSAPVARHHSEKALDSPSVHFG